MRYAHGSLGAPRPLVLPHLPKTPAVLTSGTSASATTPPRGIERAIARASARTGVDFSYLMEKANVESSMNPTAKARNSTASGLYQFIETTWLELVRNYGHKYGLSTYADCIDQNCQVKNPRLRKAILDLRHDPETSACMAAEYAAQNAGTLKSKMGKNTPIGETELYMAHFLGAGGAAKFLEALSKNPAQRAAHLFPTEARANPGVFYDSKTGRSRTLDQIYNHFAARFHAPASTPEKDEPIMMLSKKGPLRPPRQLEQKPLETKEESPLSLAMPDDPANENGADAWVEGTPVAGLPPSFIDALVQSPPRLFSQPEDPPSAQAATALHQSALLVLAQNLAHADSDRYNA